MLPSGEDRGRAQTERSTVLVIQDNFAVRSLVAESLALGGYCVLEAMTGAEGIRKFRKHTSEVSLVIIDMSQPGIDGLTVAAKLERGRPRLRILYTFLSDASITAASLRKQTEVAVRTGSRLRGRRPHRR